MSDEMKKGSQELNDNELEHVYGGYNYVRITRNFRNDFYLHYTGGENGRDRKYLCPKCGRLVHYGKGWSYYCDPCDEHWFSEDQLIPNVAGGLWESVGNGDIPWYGCPQIKVDSDEELHKIMNWK